MGLDDPEKFKELWSSRSGAGKVILCVSFICSMFAFGSIADTVFAFKGFVANGISFYRGIMAPVSEWFGQLLGIHILQDLVDLAAITTLTSFTIFRRRHKFKKNKIKRDIRAGFRYLSTGSPPSSQLTIRGPLVFKS